MEEKDGSNFHATVTIVSPFCETHTDGQSIAPAFSLLQHCLGRQVQRPWQCLANLQSRLSHHLANRLLLNIYDIPGTLPVRCQDVTEEDAAPFCRWGKRDPGRVS